MSDVMEKSVAMGALPVPLRVAVCGEAAALSATKSIAVNVAAEAGVNVTEKVQLAEAARVTPHVVVSAKSAGLAPVMLMPLMLSVAFPVLDSVTVCAAAVEPAVVDAKARVVGESVATGAAGATPVPVNATVCGEPVALSETERDAPKLAADAGVKVTPMLQVPRDASDVPQVLVETAKSAGLAPVMLTPEIASAALPGLDRVMDWAVAIAPTVVFVNATVVGESTA